MKPYKIVCYEPGCASVIDRATGERVGYLLQNHRSDWKGYLDRQRGVTVTYQRYRADAAEDVWAAR